MVQTVGTSAKIRKAIAAEIGRRAKSKGRTKKRSSPYLTRTSGTSERTPLKVCSFLPLTLGEEGGKKAKVAGSVVLAKAPQDMLVRELQAELKKLGANTVGKKAELIARLEEYL